MKIRFLWIVLTILLISGAVMASEENPQARIITSLGEIILELDAKAAPKTVENFLTYARSEFYNNTIFHRVISGFMIQGGGLTADLQRKNTRPPITNEADNGLKNLPGTIAMARTAHPHSATSQFFINAADNNFLNFKSKTQNGWGYCVFGKVIQGMDVVRAIESVPTTTRAGRSDVPVSPILIKQVVVPEKQ